MPRDLRWNSEAGSDGMFNACEGKSVCGVIQVEPTREGETHGCVDLCYESNEGCIVNDPELFRNDTEELKHRYMYQDLQGTCLQYLPSAYPHQSTAAARAAAKLRRQIERTQALAGAEACKGHRVVIAKDRPDAGMGVKLIHLATNLAFATSKGFAFTAGADFLSDFVDAERCGSIQAGRVNIFCYLEPFTPCASDDAAVHVAVNIGGLAKMVPTFTMDEEPEYVSLGGFWFEAQVLNYMWRLTPAVRDYISKKRAEINWNDWRGAPVLKGGEGGVLGMHVRRGDSCKYDRYCPPLNVSYHKLALEFKRKYRVTKVFMATDDQAAIDECETWEEFDCRGFQLDRSVYEYDDREFFEVRSRHAMNGAQRYAAAMDFFADLDTLAECDYFVGLFSSIMSRIAYELMFARKGMHVPFASIQWPLAHTNGAIN